MKTIKMIMILVAAMALLCTGPLMADGRGVNWGNGHMIMGWEPNHGPTSPGPVNTPGMAPQTPPQMPPNLVWQFPYQPVSPEERQGLIQMRQEMKLARDVSRALYNRWHNPVFLNSANAQQAQMDTMKTLLDKYGIADPVVDNTPGTFSDPHYTELYNSMVARGMASMESALSMGANLEDRAIFAMNSMMAVTDNDDIMAVYQNMMVSSQNHMRTFVGMMEGQGMSYNPQYISHDEMEQIMSMPWQ